MKFAAPPAAAAAPASRLLLAAPAAWDALAARAKAMQVPPHRILLSN
eukprot:CAMPEP_0119110732 /NCGR_PEP_ID=MMETSP1180-20130426/31705_1 /TAXON_ID=3052 ORGANISM="Chlamydomonas cf sp, Strain CCMP681" /NCGR_SAMPLE_ID=MMETSP1180 /ASSEMBLY_ACC=CAM_ASM_000741 /LENGTH=46 /DNA_ID= /DNA_START= /DNA_END= /DNA_ORIENTATION=